MSKKSTGTESAAEWPEEDIEIIRSLCLAYKNKKVRKSKGFLDILSRLGKDKIREKIKQLGLRLPGSDWTPEENELLKIDGAATSRQFIKERLPHRTFRSVSIQLGLLGVIGGEGLVAPQGFIFLAEAVRITGLDYRAIKSVAKERGVLLRRIIGRKRCPKGMRYYVDEEEIVSAVKDHLNELNGLVTTNEIMAEFPSISQSMFRRALRKSCIDVKVTTGVLTRFTVEQADKVREQIRIRVKELEIFNASAKAKKDADAKKKSTMDIPQGYVPLSEALSIAGITEEEMRVEIANCKKMAITIRGDTYIGKNKVRQIWEEKHVTVSMLMKEFGVTHQVVYRSFDLSGINRPGVHGKKSFLAAQEAEKVRSILAHRQVMLDSRCGKKVDS